MARRSLGVRLLTMLALYGAVAAADLASAQRGDERPDRRVQEPRELLREYPFRQGRLRSREREASGRANAAERADSGGPSGERPVDGGWPVILLVFGVATALLALAVAGRRVARATVGGDPDGGAAASVEEGQPGVKDAERAREVPAEAPELSPPPSLPREPRVQRRPTGRRPTSSYAVANQKGGVGKTTVSLTLGAAAARRGSRVLLVDLDPQASATMVVGVDVEDRPTVADVMLEAASSLEAAVTPTRWGLDLVPSERALRAADTGAPAGDEAVLARQLETVGDYDLVLIDCPPSLGTLTTEALNAVSRALVVVEPTYLALQAMDELLDTIRHVADEQNPSLELAGVVLNRAEATSEHRRSVAELQDAFGSQVWEPHIPKRAVLQDAMRQGVPPQDLPTHYAREVAELFDALAERLQASRAKA